jgi:NAD+ kinase
VIYRKLGFLCHPHETEARALAERLMESVASSEIAVWLAETGDETTAHAHMPGTDLLVCIGGDGTTLWAARLAAAFACRIVSVNMGRLGFLSLLSPRDADSGLRAILGGEGIVEERAMVEYVPLADPEARPEVGLNDVVVGRGAPGRPVYVSIAIDGEHLATVRADAIIVATATGSTAYNLSAGGPILMPTDPSLLLTPVAPHLSRMRPFVLPPDSVIDLTVRSELGALVSVDGQVTRALANGESIRCRRAAARARFIVFGGPTEFFHRLALSLNLGSRGEEIDP